ncbi:hypothetical protein PPS11_41280 [Pseudomonas putida S11]|nr:hypothetical protein PPS11_41280 [Pseudomonas putida S11]
MIGDSKQAVEKALAGEAVAGDRQARRHGDQSGQRGSQGREFQAVVKRIEEIGTLEHGAEPAQREAGGGQAEGVFPG